MVRADRFIGSRIAQSENEKFLWWAEGRKFSNVQCDWGARALGNMQSALPEQSGGCFGVVSVRGSCAV